MTVHGALLLLWMVGLALGQQTATNFLTRCLAREGLVLPNIITCTTRADRSEITWTLDTIKNISDCHFINCGSIFVKTSVAFHRITFTNSSSVNDGGAIRIDKDISVEFNQVVFQGTKSTRRGGAIYMSENSRVSLQHVNFTSISCSDSGGAIYMSREAHLSALDVNFTRNTAANQGGSLYISQNATCLLTMVDFIGGTTSYSRGGDVFNEGGSFSWTRGSSRGLVLNASNVQSNASNWTVQSPSGASLSTNMEAYNSLSHITFHGQRASELGGVLHVSGRAKVYMHHIHVSDVASGRNGGFLYAVDHAQVVCSYCQFDSVYAEKSGAVVFADADITFQHVLSNNTLVRSDRGGFAAFGPLASFTGYNVSIYNASILMDREEACGGGISFIGKFMNLSHSLLSNNKGTFGGAVFLLKYHQDKDTLISISNTRFLSNQARYGAAINANYYSLTLNNVEMTGNKAEYYGSVLSYENHDPTHILLLQGSFIATHNLVVNKQVTSYDAIQGGTIYTKGTVNMVIQTSLLYMAQNQAPFGTCMLLSSTQGSLVYEPLANATLHLMGIVYMTDPTFIQLMKQLEYASLWNRLDVTLDSPPVGSRITQHAFTLLPSMTLDASWTVPEFQVELINAFGTPVILPHPNILTFATVHFFDPSRLPLHPLYSVTKTGQAGHVGKHTFPRVSLYSTKHSHPFLTVIKAIILPYYQQADFIDTTQGHLNYTRLLQNPHYATITFRIEQQQECSPNEQTMYILDTNQYNKTYCVPIYSLDPSARWSLFMTTSVLMLMIVVLGGILYKKKRDKEYKKRSTLSTFLVIVGLELQFMACLCRLLSTPYACMTSTCLDFVGCVLVASTLIIKTQQIKTIFLGSHELNGFQKPLGTVSFVLRVLGMSLVALVFQVSWILVEPEYPFDKLVQNGIPLFINKDSCPSSPISLFHIIEWTIRGCLMLGLAVETGSTRSIPSVYAETYSLSLISYSLILSHWVFIPLERALILTPLGEYGLYLFRIYIPSILTTLLLLTPLQIHFATSSVMTSMDDVVFHRHSPFGLFHFFSWFHRGYSNRKSVQVRSDAARSSVGFTSSHLSDKESSQHSMYTLSTYLFGNTTTSSLLGQKSHMSVEEQEVVVVEASCSAIEKKKAMKRSASRMNKT